MGLFDIFKKTKPAPQPPDPREVFAHEVESVLRGDELVTAVERIAGEFALRVKCGGEESTLFLHNVFAETRELSPEARADRIRGFLGSFPNEREWEWEEARPNLLVTVRASTYGAGPSPTGELMPRRAAREFAPFLDATLVIDEPGSMGYVSREQLGKWGVDEEEAFAVALRNTSALASGPMETYSEMYGPVWHLPGEDVYATSRLLLPGWLASMKDRVEGRPLAIIPERSTLFVGGDARPEVVRWLAETAQREWESTTRGISPAVYTVDDTTALVVPYRPAGTGETANLIRMGCEKLRAQTYEEQREGLASHYQRTGVDLFVAKATLMRLDDGRPYSYCPWVEDVTSLLPVTDLVMATGGTKEDGTFWLARVPFEIAKKIGGPLWARAEVPFGPERYSVSGAISPEQKAALLAASRPPEELV
jgi:hypothetical protein